MFTKKKKNRRRLHKRLKRKLLIDDSPHNLSRTSIATEELVSHFVSSIYLGVMVGTAPLTRSLPDTSDDTQGFIIIEDEEGGVISFPLSVLIVTVVVVSDSDIICHIPSSSRTTSAIDGLASVSSLQHFMARVKNLSMQSEG